MLLTLDYVYPFGCRIALQMVATFVCQLIWRHEPEKAIPLESKLLPYYTISAPEQTFDSLTFAPSFFSAESMNSITIGVRRRRGMAYYYYNSSSMVLLGLSLPTVY